jgi:lysozyme
MKLSTNGLCEIAAHEAIVTSPYFDSRDVLTWGVGHTAAAGTPDPATLPMGEPQPMKDILECFKRDIADCERRVNAAVKAPVEQHEFDALVSFDFNTGGINRAKLVKLLNDGQRREAAEAFLGWLRPPEIEKRRRAEMALFRTGTYSNGGTATAYPADAKGKVLWSKGVRVNLMNELRAMNDIRTTDLTKSRTMAGATLAGVPGAGIAVDGVVELVDATEKAGSFLDGGSIIKIVVGLVILCGALYAAYARATDAGWSPPWRRKRVGKE